MLKRWILQFFILVFISFFFAFLSNTLASRERKLAWIKDYSGATKPAGKESVTQSPSSTISQTKQKQPIEMITGDQAFEYFQQGILFLDARRSEHYEAGHIPGAQSIPVWESDVDQRIENLLARGISLEAPVVIYCSGGACEDSRLLAEKLFEQGFSRLLLYEGGFPDWQANHRPVETGPGL